MSTHKALTKIKANNEYGRLREIFFGRVDDFVVPAWDPVAFCWLDDKMSNLLKNHGGKLLSEADPVWFNKVKEQVERAAKFIESKGVIVHRPEEHSETEMANFALSGALNVNLYNRDSIVTIGDTIVETGLKTPERLRNKYAIRRATMELMRKGNRVISMPQPLDTYHHDDEKEAIIEGGDVFVDLDNNSIYIGNSGNASNDLGYYFLKSAFPQYDVYQIKIDTSEFDHQHLDCVMILSKDWGIILEDAIPGGIESLPEPLRKRKWIIMELRESELKLANMMVFDENEVIIAEEATRLIDELEAIGVTCNKLPYYEVGEIGGAFRCNHHPIYRD